MCQQHVFHQTTTTRRRSLRTNTTFLPRSHTTIKRRRVPIQGWTMYVMIFFRRSNTKLIKRRIVGVHWGQFSNREILDESRISSNYEVSTPCFPSNNNNKKLEFKYDLPTSEWHHHETTYNWNLRMNSDGELLDEQRPSFWFSCVSDMYACDRQSPVCKLKIEELTSITST